MSAAPLLLQALGPDSALWRAQDPAGAGAEPSRNAAAAGLAWARRCFSAAGLRNARGTALQPAPAPRRGDKGALHYEVAVFEQGQVSFKTDRYHDWFNLLIWRLWPLTKAALNLRHVLHHRAQLRGGGDLRARARGNQLLACLDEGGCVVSRDLLAQARVQKGGPGGSVYELPAGAADEAGLRVFGHAALELLATAPPAELRLWMVVLDGDLAGADPRLARRVLCISPAAFPEVEPLLRELPPLLPFFQEALRMGAEDPFAGPFDTLLCPFRSGAAG